MLSTTPETVSDCIRYRGLPAAKIGRAWVLVDDDVIAWLRQQYAGYDDAEGRPVLDAGPAVVPRRSVDALDAALAPRKRVRRNREALR